MPFKSFQLCKYTKSKKYMIEIGTSDKKDPLIALCSECGYPFGEHFGSFNMCPSKSAVEKYLKPVKH